MKILFAILLTTSFFLGNTMNAQVVGKWKTIDDETGKEKSIIEIYKKNDRLFGKIVKIIDPARANARCTKCEGSTYNTPLIGLNIIKNMKKSDDEYEGGTIFDPEEGKTYKSKMWLEEDNNDVLNVRGYIAFFFRTQQWVRMK